MSRLATDRTGFPATVPTAYAPKMQGAVVGVAVALLAGGALALSVPYGWRHAALFLVGGALGLVLYHAAFGFTAAFRALVTAGDTRGLRAQMLMLAVATVLFAPMLSAESVFGNEVVGAVAPAGLSVLLGACLFAIGMQVAGGCGSGCLFNLGGGATPMIVALAGFAAGSLVATAHAGFWRTLPSFGAVSLGDTIGWGPAVALQLVAFALIALGARAYERRRLGDVRPVRPPVSGWRRLVHGPWPLVAGGVALAVLNALVVVLAGHPWGITWGILLAGAKVVSLPGIDLSRIPFWRDGFPADALAAPLVADQTAMMDLGIVFGALLAAGLAGRFHAGRVTPAGALTALGGGLLLGYGARLAFGCNIGAYFSGIASTSVHGWIWLAGALIGTPFGVALRRRLDGDS
ncbi:MAG TPA: YeeE/YedE family protein [Methylomirabilota bacterium]|nr:YeeE/YedE family protein [Methylomirabilota bacterium]